MHFFLQGKEDRAPKLQTLLTDVVELDELGMGSMPTECKYILFFLSHKFDR